MDFSLRLEVDEIHDLASRYAYRSDAQIVNDVAPRVRSNGFFTKPDFLTVCSWKSPRSKRLFTRNSEGLIEDATRIALSTPHERLRIGVLTLLHGVNWSIASVLLHFAHTDPYPILDFRALWSLGIKKPPKYYSFDFWWAYTQYCRDLAKANGVSMRVLDRALWQYSKERQPI
jgi:hypothetical protein